MRCAPPPRNAAHPHAIVDPARLAQTPDTLERAPPPPRVLPWSAYIKAKSWAHSRAAPGREQAATLHTLREDEPDAAGRTNSTCRDKNKRGVYYLL